LLGLELLLLRQRSIWWWGLTHLLVRSFFLCYFLFVSLFVGFGRNKGLARSHIDNPGSALAHPGPFRVFCIGLVYVVAGQAAGTGADDLFRLLSRVRGHRRAGNLRFGIARSAAAAPIDAAMEVSRPAVLIGVIGGVFLARGGAGHDKDAVDAVAGRSLFESRPAPCRPVFSDLVADVHELGRADQRSTHVLRLEPVVVHADVSRILILDEAGARVAYEEAVLNSYVLRPVGYGHAVVHRARGGDVGHQDVFGRGLEAEVVAGIPQVDVLDYEILSGEFEHPLGGVAIAPERRGPAAVNGEVGAAADRRLARGDEISLDLDIDVAAIDRLGEFVEGGHDDFLAAQAAFVDPEALGRLGAGDRVGSLSGFLGVSGAGRRGISEVLDVHYHLAQGSVERLRVGF